MTSPVTQITDHIARMKADILGAYQDDPIALAICDVIGAEVQRLENFLYSVLTNIILANAEGAVLDRIGKIVRAYRGARSDDEYRALISVIIAAYNSESGVDQILWIVQNLIGETCEYRKYPPAAYRLSYVTATTISDQLAADAARVMEIATSAGVGYQLSEGASTDAFRFNSGPGFNDGKLGHRIV